MLFVGKVCGDAIEMAIWLFGGELGVFVVEDVWVIDFDPTQILRQWQAVGAGVHSGGDVDDSVDAEGKGFLNESVDGDGADSEGKGHGFGLGKGRTDFAAAIAGEFCGEVVVEDGIGSRGFFSADCGDPECGVGDVSDHCWEEYKCRSKWPQKGTKVAKILSHDAVAVARLHGLFCWGEKNYDSNQTGIRGRRPR